MSKEMAVHVDSKTQVGHGGQSTRRRYGRGARRLLSWLTPGTLALLGACPGSGTCDDGVQNQGEEGVDCGGPCAACQVTESCQVGAPNQGERGIDCDGPTGLVHPGISHTRADLDRMKYMVEAGADPWKATFDAMRENPRASFDYSVNGDPANTVITTHGAFIDDGFAAYLNALMWYVTGDERHAEKCVEIFNAWSNITRIEDQFALNNGRGPWKMLEGAEIIKHTYPGWSAEDQQRFAAMLVYPGWSGTESPTSAMQSKDVSFYWNIYQGDRFRHGNQGLYAFRSLMAMGIFLDNEVIYQRALRYLQGLPHLPEDLPYPSGPPMTTPADTGCEYYDEFVVNGYGDDEDYGYNEVIEHYIWETGQSQESSRDQAHGLGGVSAISCLAEMAWTQSDDLYGHLDNRLLTGWEFYYRYNLSLENTYPDQLEPWEPTVASGEFIERTDRSGRWKSLSINPYLACNGTTEDLLERGNKHMTEPVYEQSLGHYRDRLLLEPEQYKWLQRGFDFMTDSIGLEDGRQAVDHAGWGGLKFHRVSPGDPISGFESSGLPIYEMPVLPATIEAENFDYFATGGEGKTYSDSTAANLGGVYRPSEGVDLQTTSEGGYAIGSIVDGEWVTYTVYVPADGDYDIAIRYASTAPSGSVQVSFNDAEVTGDVALPFGAPHSSGANDWQDFTVATDAALSRGVQPMKLRFSGASGAFAISSIAIEASTPLGSDAPAVAPGGAL